MTAAQGTPNRGKGGKSINLIKSDIFFDFSPKWSWGPLDRLKILSWSPLRFSTIGKPILRTFQILTFLTNFRPWPNFDQMPTIYLNKDLIFLISDDFDKSKKMRNVRTIIFHQVSRRDLCYVSENKGFRFWEKIIWSVICPRNLLPGNGPGRAPPTPLPHAPGVRMTWVHK